MTDITAHLDQILNEASRPGAWEAMQLQQTIRDLVSRSPKCELTPHELFANLCQLVHDSMKDYISAPCSSPAADALLAYVTFALSRYQRALRDCPTPPSTSKRQQLLARAFFMTGKPGGEITSEQRNAICAAYDLGARSSPDSDWNRAGERAAFLAHHGRDYGSADERTDRANIKRIRKVLLESGYSNDRLDKHKKRARTRLKAEATKKKGEGDD